MLRGMSAQTIIKGPVCPRNVMFWSLIIINTSLAARRTRTRVIRGYDSTREGAWGTKCLFLYFNYPFFVQGRGSITWASWGRPRGSRFPTRLLKPTSSLMRGLEWWLVRWFPVRSLIYLTQFHAPTYPFIDPSSFTSWLWKGKWIVEELAMG